MDEPQRVAEERGVGKRKGIVVTGDDIDILAFVNDYRLLNIDQVAALTGRTYTRIHRRLKGLFDAGYLKRRARPQKKDVYHIGRPAVSLLLSHGRISDDDAERRRREHELKPETLDHEMMLADVHVALELAGRNGPVQLSSWREGKEISDTFDGVGFEQRKVTIEPDAFFQLKDGSGNHRSFLLEADRSTMPTQPRAGSRRFRDKIERYCAFITTGRAFARYGVSSIRIFTLTLTALRRDNLCADTEAYLVENNLANLRKYFLFGGLSDVSFANPAVASDPLLHRPGSSKLFPLFPALAERGESA